MEPTIANVTEGYTDAREKAALQKERGASDPAMRPYERANQAQLNHPLRKGATDA